MKFVIAPDKFKGSLTGFEFCDAVEQGLRTVMSHAEIIKMPLADGGDGTVEVIQHYIGGEKISVRVSDPLFRSIEASYIFQKNTGIAFIEMAEASGLRLLKEHEYNCMNTTTLGTGQMIVNALERGAETIILTIGGSATNDGGMGMANALGYTFFDIQNQKLQPIGKHLIDLRKIDGSRVHPRLKNVEIKVACDVSNPFFGPDGAACVYASQKGASKKEIAQLDKGLRNFAKVVQSQYATDLQNLKGSGAAGGMGGGAHVFLKGTLISGIKLIKELADFDKVIKDADWIITGEGSLDAQTFAGKTIIEVLRSAHQNNIPVAAICGRVHLSDPEKEQLGLTYIDAVSESSANMKIAMDSAYESVIKSAVGFARTLI